MRKLIIGLIVFAALAAVVKVYGPSIQRAAERKALSLVGAVIDPATQDIIVEQRIIADNLRQATTRNTESADAIKAELRKLQGQNAALRAELDRIGGEVTSVATSVSRVDIAAGDTSEVGDGDFEHVYEDPWIKAMIERRGRDLMFNYQTTFRIEEFDVEVTLPDGSRTHLFNTALVSESTGDTLHVPTERHVVERSLGDTGFHIAPQLHLRVAGGLGRAFIGMGVSAFTWGDGKYIEATKFFLVEGTILYNSDGFSVALVPATWNIGRSLPLIENLNIGVGWAWGENQSGVIFLIGAAL